MPARLDAILVGNIEDLDEILQTELGRVNRIKSKTEIARGIIYVSSSTRKAAEKVLADEETGIAPKAGQKPPDLSFTHIIVAKCKVKCQDDLYGNPPVDPPRTCTACVQAPPHSHPSSCNCIGCIPETLPTLAKPLSVSRVNTSISKAKRLIKLQRAHGLTFLLDTLITSILDNYILLNTIPKVSEHIKSHEYSNRLLEVLKELSPQFMGYKYFFYLCVFL
ncbi:hypothetical protein C8R44DRAFT_980678 [Mycena epipterygia]|nr:hypothetical protein C8R44DRAFT_980678 [Mycena epipterygia]